MKKKAAFVAIVALTGAVVSLTAIEMFNKKQAPGVVPLLSAALCAVLVTDAGGLTNGRRWAKLLFGAAAALNLVAAAVAIIGALRAV